MKKTILCALLLSLSGGFAAAQQPKPAPVTVTGEVDKTAIWVGDELRYTIRAVYDRNVEMVLDNFTKERLPLPPFVIQDIDIQRKDWTGGKRAVEITLRLTTYETAKPDLTIPLIQLYYFVREAGLGDKERPVDVVPAAAVKIGLRSALVTDSLIPRTNKPPSAPGLAWALLPFAIGFAGLMSLGAYGGLRMWQKLHPDEGTGGLTREAREAIVRDSLARLHADTASAGEDPHKWSAAIASALRAMVSELFHIPGAAQTPEEIEMALEFSGADEALAAQVKSVLAQLDEMRYGKDGGEHRPRAQMLQAVERIMQSPRWVSA